MPRLVIVWGLVLLTGWYATAAAGEDLAVTNVTLYPSPGAPAMEAATVIIRQGRITRVGTDLDTEGLPALDGGGRVATAGLWNCHVHFTDPQVSSAPAVVLRDMLLRYGFTSVVDTGSVLADTLALAGEIEAGNLDGPRIVTANGSLVYVDGTPSYLPGVRLPEADSPQRARVLVNHFLDVGADGIKIFSGSFKSAAETVLLPADIIRAVTDAAHARGSFVISHPTSREGLENAVRNGIDVLAHSAPQAGPLEPELIETMLANRVGLIPTLKLWSWEGRRAGMPAAAVAAFQNVGVEQVRAYAAAGGEILFGTDVGYMRDYDPAEEFRMMQRAGMGFRRILAALTTAPALRFAGESGRVEPGAPGDLAIFATSPAAQPVAFAQVAHTIRGGRIVHAQSR